MEIDLNENVRYHLKELETARDNKSRFYVMPSFIDTDRCILDIGCGIGQTLVASQLDPSTLLYGLDVDLTALNYGRINFPHINFVNGCAEYLPFRNSHFDYVISRVTLPYTNMPTTITEISRVLKIGGRIWVVLHPFRMVARELVKSILSLDSRGVARRICTILNGINLHCIGRQFRIPPKLTYEAFQTRSGTFRLLRKSGFVNIRFDETKHFIVTAEKQVE